MVNFPVFGAGGQIVCIIHRVEDVTESVQLKQKDAEQRATNIALRDSRAAALNLMRDAVAARQQAERANETLRREIADRKLAEEELRESREDMSRAQQVGQIGSWRLDVRRNVLTWSDETHRIFGVPKGTPMTYEAFLALVHPDDRQYVDTKWNAGLRGEPYDIEHRIVADGRTKWVREKAYLEFDDAGHLLGGFGIIQDLTKRKQAEDALLQAKEELEQRVHERTAQIRALALELSQAEQRERKRLSLVLHDHLQQLLVGAKLSLVLARRREIDEEARPHLDQVATLLDETIAASKSLTVELSPPILHEVGLVAALNWLGRWMREKHGLAVEVEAGAEIEPDPEGVCMLLFQCVRELLFNSVKHSGAKSARVSVGRRDDHIEIVVADRGSALIPHVPKPMIPRRDSACSAFANGCAWWAGE